MLLLAIYVVSLQHETHLHSQRAVVAKAAAAVAAHTVVAPTAEPVGLLCVGDEAGAATSISRSVLTRTEQSSVVLYDKDLRMLSIC